MDIVIKFDSNSNEYNLYESTSNTLLKSKSLSDGLLNLSSFLKMSKNVPEGTDLLQLSNITYHLDSSTMKDIVVGNAKLLKRLQNDQSQFKKSSNKFNGGSDTRPKGKSDFTKGNSTFGKGKFSGSSNFKNSYKKWGNYNNGF